MPISSQEHDRPKDDLITYVKEVILGLLPVDLQSGVEIQVVEHGSEGKPAALHFHVRGPRSAMSRIVGRDGQVVRALDTIVRHASWTRQRRFAFVHCA